MKKFDDLMDNFFYYEICQQIKENNDWKFQEEFDHTLSIVLVTDHFLGYAAGMQEYFSHFEDVRAVVVHSAEEWAERVECPGIKPDFCIFVGILKDKQMYQLCENAKALNRHAVTLLLDYIISMTVEEKERYGIDECFEMYLPLYILVPYLRVKYAKKKKIENLPHVKQEIMDQLDHMKKRMDQKLQMTDELFLKLLKK